MYEGRGWNIKGDHTGPTWNTRAIGISFMGNFMGELGAVGSKAGSHRTPRWQVAPFSEPLPSLIVGAIFNRSMEGGVGCEDCRH